MNAQPATDLREELQRLVSLGETLGLCLRGLGGVAVALHSPSANLPALQRSYADLDLVAGKNGAERLDGFFVEQGYEPDRQFNALNGDRRRLFFDVTHQRQVDVFIERFEMCHHLSLTGRLALDSPTLTVSDLYLTKAQIAQLNEKDALDLATLLLDHGLMRQEGDCLNLDYVIGLCAEDWGWYTTLSMNHERLLGLLAQGKLGLNTQQTQQVKERIESLQVAMVNAPKTLAWKLRDRLGRRVRWYEEVEEVQR